HAFKRSLWGGSEVQQPSRFLDEIPAALLQGMEDRRARREASYQRITRWDSGDAPRRARRAASDRWESSPRRSSSESTRTTYWSPGASSEGGKRASQRAGARRSKADAKLEFKRRDSVQHPKFGVGTVIDSNLVGGEEEVTVAFP